MAKSPCRGLATRSLAGAGVCRRRRFFGKDGTALRSRASTGCPRPPTFTPVSLAAGDITCLRTNAIVNAANASLLGGGGVDGAIHRAAGPGLLAECRTLGGCRPGEARLSRGYRLPAPFVIHTVGPIWQGGGAGERLVLESCYASCLAIARAQRFCDIAFPAIATGAYGYPRKEAAQIALAAAWAHLAAHELPERIVFVGFDEATQDAYRAALAALP